jgi:hypothetical protein
VRQYRRRAIVTISDGTGRFEYVIIADIKADNGVTYAP